MVVSGNDHHLHFNLKGFPCVLLFITSNSQQRVGDEATGLCAELGLALAFRRQACFPFTIDSVGSCALGDSGTDCDYPLSTLFLAAHSNSPAREACALSPELRPCLRRQSKYQFYPSEFCSGNRGRGCDIHSSVCQGHLLFLGRGEKRGHD